MSYRRKPVAGVSYSSFLTDKNIQRFPDTPVQIGSAWTEVIAEGAIGNEFAVCGIGIAPVLTSTPDWWTQIIKVGYGSAGAEQVAIELPVMQRHQYDGYGGKGIAHRFTHFIEPFRKFPAGTRIALKGSSATPLLYLSVAVVETTPELANLTSNNIRSFPQNSYATVNSGDTAWTFGSWTEVIPAGTISGEFIVCGILVVHPGWTTTERHIYFDGTVQVGENETPKITLPVRHDAVPYGQGEAIIAVPQQIRVFTKFASGAKVSVRVADSMDEAIPYHVCIQTCEVPL